MDRKDIQKNVNPVNDFESKDYPAIVLVDDLNSPFASIVRFFNKTYHLKEHIKDSYSHVMFLTNSNTVATQNFNGYVYKPLSAYMKKGIRLKFFSMPLLEISERIFLFDKIMEGLNAPWWKRRYDFLGLAGQAVHIKWIQSPLSEFCSENMANALRGLDRYKEVVPKRPSPSDINLLCEKYSMEFKFKGYWIGAKCST